MYKLNINEVPAIIYGYLTMQIVLLSGLGFILLSTSYYLCYRPWRAKLQQKRDKDRRMVLFTGERRPEGYFQSTLTRKNMLKLLRNPPPLDPSTMPVELLQHLSVVHDVLQVRLHTPGIFRRRVY